VCASAASSEAAHNQKAAKSSVAHSLLLLLHTAQPRRCAFLSQPFLE
jgi:hypothetical protein